MARRVPVGDANLIEFFALGTNAFATKQAHVANRGKGYKVTGHPTKKSMTIDVDSRFGDSDWNTFLGSYLTNQDLTPITEEYSDGSMETVSPATTAQSFGYTVYFGVLSTSRKVLYGVGVLTGDTGGVETAGKAFEKAPLQISAVPAAVTYALATTIWNTSYVSTAAAPTSLAADSYGAYWFATAA